MASREVARPNVILVLTDDQGPWAMGCAGNTEIHTPTFDAIAAAGARMTNFYCASPVCSPARATLLTGRMPSAHGVHDYLDASGVGAGSVDFLAGQRCYTDDLADAGYRLGMIGKWHLGANDTPRAGFVRWLAHDAGGGPYYGAPLHDENGPVDAPGYVTETFTDAAVEFIEAEAGRDEPFYLSLHYTAPHSPWKDSHPAELTDLYAHCPFESVPTEPRHPWVPLDGGVPIGGEPDTRAALEGYFAAVTGVDAGVGRVLAAVHEAGLTESTVVIVTSDNGFNCGHHGIWGKGNGTFPQNMYEESVTVPFLISWPGQSPAGQVRDELLSAYDLAPSIRELCGIVEPEDPLAPGRSFLPLLRGEDYRRDDDGERAGEPREHVVVCDEYGPVRMIRTRDWKYVHRYPHGPHELYHLAADPGERTNWVDDPAQAGRRADLAGRLDGWFAAHSRAEADGSSLPVTGAGQRGPVWDSSGLTAFTEPTAFASTPGLSWQGTERRV